MDGNLNIDIYILNTALTYYTQETKINDPPEEMKGILNMNG